MKKFIIIFFVIFFNSFNAYNLDLFLGEKAFYEKNYDKATYFFSKLKKSKNEDLISLSTAYLLRIKIETKSINYDLFFDYLFKRFLDTEELKYVKSTIPEQRTGNIIKLNKKYKRSDKIEKDKPMPKPKKEKIKKYYTNKNILLNIDEFIKNSKVNFIDHFIKFKIYDKGIFDYDISFFKIDELKNEYYEKFYQKFLKIFDKKFNKTNYIKIEEYSHKKNNFLDLKFYEEFNKSLISKFNILICDLLCENLFKDYEMLIYDPDFHSWVNHSDKLKNNIGDVFINKLSDELNYKITTDEYNKFADNLGNFLEFKFDDDLIEDDRMNVFEFLNEFKFILKEKIESLNHFRAENKNKDIIKIPENLKNLEYKDLDDSYNFNLLEEKKVGLNGNNLFNYKLKNKNNFESPMKNDLDDEDKNKNSSDIKVNKSAKQFNYEIPFKDNIEWFFHDEFFYNMVYYIYAVESKKQEYFFSKSDYLNYLHYQMFLNIFNSFVNYSSSSKDHFDFNLECYEYSWLDDYFKDLYKIFYSYSLNRSLKLSNKYFSEDFYFIPIKHFLIDRKLMPFVDLRLLFIFFKSLNELYLDDVTISILEDFYVS